ncbi:MAG: NADPH-dependent F420 reductase [Actinomycetota bacterium]|nr:NADPH-dependent F420 reductase [Actinomycetota bacterium]
MPSDDLTGTRLAILGGTGQQGRGLACRLAAAGVAVTLGSRDPDRAAAAAVEVQDIARRLAGSDLSRPVTGGANADVVPDADVVVVSVPWAAHGDTLRELEPALRDLIVVDTVNPLGFDGRGPYALGVAEGSAAEQAAALLPRCRVVAAFQHVSAVLLLDPQLPTIETDVLVLSDDRAAADQVIALAGAVPGMRGILAGRLRNAGQVEALTANLIAINKRYKAHAGIRVTDV